MRAYGSDRLRMKGDRAILFCTRPKPNWVPRVAKTLTTSEHPGTAVVCDDEFWEVVEALQVGNSIRYELEPWRDEHIMRGSDVYDEASEAARAVEHRKTVSRTRKRFAIRAGGVLAGYLPAEVQNELSSEFGVGANRLTTLSGMFSLAVAALCGLAFSAAALAQREAGRALDPEAPAAAASVGPLPWWLIGVALYLVFETIIRFFFVLSQNRPIASPLGFFAYCTFWLVSPGRSKLVSPFAEPKGEGLFTLEPEEHVVISDKAQTWAPFLTLLTPDEQRRLMHTCGFDYRVHATKVATFILLFSGIGVVTTLQKLQTSSRVSLFASLAVALGLAVEQVFRLAAFRQGPSGSVLGILVRPFVRKLLELR